MASLERRLQSGRIVGHRRPQPGLALDGSLRILEAVSGEHGDDDPAAEVLLLAGESEEARHRRRAGGLAEHAGLAGEPPPGGEDLRVAHGREQASRLALRGQRRLPGGRIPDADGGGHRLRLESRRQAERISASLTAANKPPDSRCAASAVFQEAGFPMRMAVATVSGWGTGTPDTSGAAPDAWKPSIAGLWPPSSQKPRQYALMLPAFPTGRATASGTRPSSSAISKAAVFCPSMRYGFTLFKSAIPRRAATSRTRARAASKFPRSTTMRAPCATACAIFPRATFPSGTTTLQATPATAQ